MAKFLSMEVLNGMDLANRFRLMGVRAETGAQKQVLKAGLLVGGRSKKIVHVLTGRCKASISTQLLGGTLMTKPVSLTGPQVEYGAALESRYPYMKPGLEQSKEEIRRLFGDLLIEIVKR